MCGEPLAILKLIHRRVKIISFQACVISPKTSLRINETNQVSVENVTENNM